VTTDVRQARDAFYVTDEANQKITNPLRLQEIKERIEAALEQKGPTASSQCESTKGKRRVKAR
jgi:UTP:GlnB (protein PII) uridylyltransferase